MQYYARHEETRGLRPAITDSGNTTTTYSEGLEGEFRSATESHTWRIYDAIEGGVLAMDAYTLGRAPAAVTARP